MIKRLYLIALTILITCSLSHILIYLKNILPHILKRTARALVNLYFIRNEY